MSQPQASSEMHAEGMRKGCAPSRPSEPSTSTRKEKGGTQGQQGESIWQIIKADLHSIKEGLEKEDGNAHHVTRDLSSTRSQA